MFLVAQWLTERVWASQITKVDAEEDAVIFSFGEVVDQLKNSLGASALRSPSARGMRRRAGPAPGLLPRSALSPSGASSAAPEQRLHAMSSGAACCIPEH